MGTSKEERVIYIEILRNKYGKNIPSSVIFLSGNWREVFCCLFFKIFLTWIIFKVFIEFFMVLLPLFYINIYMGFMATRHVESWLPNQGLNPHPLHWKAKS